MRSSGATRARSPAAPRSASGSRPSSVPSARATTLEVNPIPVKTALALMGKCSDELRLPLTPLGSANRTKLEATLREYRLV